MFTSQICQAWKGGGVQPSRQSSVALLSFWLDRSTRMRHLDATNLSKQKKPPALGCFSGGFPEAHVEWELCLRMAGWWFAANRESPKAVICLGCCGSPLPESRPKDFSLQLHRKTFPVPGWSRKNLLAMSEKTGLPWAMVRQRWESSSFPFSAGKLKFPFSAGKAQVFRCVSPDRRWFCPKVCPSHAKETTVGWWGGRCGAYSTKCCKTNQNTEKS